MATSDAEEALAVAYLKMGEIYRAVGEWDLARSAMEKSLATWELLADAEPDRSDYQSHLAAVLERLGDLQADLQDIDGARSSFTRALAIRERLAAAEPSRTDLQLGPAAALARLNELSDRPKKAATRSQIINFKLLDLLPTMTPDEQLEVFERVIKSNNPAVRPRALGLGAAILSNSRLLEYLREENDVRRSAAVEILKLRRRRSLNLARHLLEDKNPEVVLQAVQILSHLRDRRALDALLKVLDHGDPNVIQEAIVALGRIGDVRALPGIRRFLKAEPWLQVAAIETIGRIGSPEVVPDLEPLLEEPVLQPLVTEALCKIGGGRAVTVLSRFWLSRPDELRKNLRRLADMLEGLTSAPPELPGLEEALEEQVRAGDKDLRIQAVRCLVALRGSNRGLWMF